MEKVDNTIIVELEAGQSVLIKCGFNKTNLNPVAIMPQDIEKK